MRKTMITTLSAALVTMSLPAEAVAGPLYGNAMHDNAFDQPGAGQPGAKLEYDSANRLRRVKRGNLDIRYVYDGLGNLEAEIVDDGQKVTRTDLMLDESGPLPRVIGALTDDGARELYAYGPMGVAIVRKSAAGQPLATYHALTDELGTVRGLADGAGALAGRVAYGPFGRVRVTEGQQTRLAFAGEYRDTAGLLWLRARHYAPFLGRFVQRDTVVDDPGNPQSLNRYTYAANNPLSNVDPTGHFIVAIGAAVLVGLMLGTLVAPIAVYLGDEAGRAGRSASDSEKAEVNRAVEGWMSANQAVSMMAGTYGGISSAYRYRGLAPATRELVSGGALDDSVAWYRVQGASTNGSRSKPLFRSDESGNPVVGWNARRRSQQGAAESTTGMSKNQRRRLERARRASDGEPDLNVSVGDLGHATYFATEVRPGASLVEIRVPKWFNDLMIETKVPQKNYNSRPNQQGTAPKVTDPNQPGLTVELPGHPWTFWTNETAVPGSFRVIHTGLPSKYSRNEPAPRR